MFGKLLWNHFYRNWQHTGTAWRIFIALLENYELLCSFAIQLKIFTKKSQTLPFIKNNLRRSRNYAYRKAYERSRQLYNQTKYTLISQNWGLLYDLRSSNKLSRIVTHVSYRISGYNTFIVYYESFRWWKEVNGRR